MNLHTPWTHIHMRALTHTHTHTRTHTACTHPALRGCFGRGRLSQAWTHMHAAHTQTHACTHKACTHPALRKVLRRGRLAQLIEGLPFGGILKQSEHGPPHQRLTCGRTNPQHTTCVDHALITQNAAAAALMDARVKFALKTQKSHPDLLQGGGMCLMRSFC